MARRTSFCALLTILATSGAAEVCAQSDSSSFYLTNRSRRLGAGTTASNFIQRSSLQSLTNRAAPRFDFSPVNNRIYSGIQSKPFSGVNRGSNLSPYLNIGGVETGVVPNYYSLVRPQLEQQKQQERARQANIAMQHELNTMAARSPYNIEGSQQMAPTGHVAVFMNYGGYYPAAQAPQRR